jgi:hypothetical protein
VEAFLIRIPGNQASDLLEDPKSFRQLLRHPQALPYERLELGETWPGLHFVLTGELPISRLEALKAGISWDEDSLENALLGGREVPHGANWGPARYLEPKIVARMAQQLSAISVEQFRDNYDAGYLEEEQIPPGGWDLPQALDELTARFRQLVSFYQRAAAAQDGVLVCTI